MRKVGAGTSITGKASPSKIGGAPQAAGYSADDLGLCLYSTPPDVEVSVRDFEEFTRDRLRVLHVFDRLCSYESRLDNIGELRPKVVKELLESRLLLEYPSGLDSDTYPERKADFQRRDAIAHFALRFAFCKTREAREWFIRNEQRLFMLRYDSMNREAQEAFISRSGLKCRKFDASKDGGELGISFHDLQHATPAAKIFRGDGKVPDWDSNFYLMPFHEVDPKLIASRRIIITGGKAYVPSAALKLILAKKFKDSLVASLEQAFQGLPTALSDPRIGGFLRDLQDYGMQLLVAPKAASEDVGEVLTLENFEELMIRSFPPCMRRLVEKQRETKKHLKHAGRLQLRPFLKDCGFTMEDSLRWFKKEITIDPQVDAASFEKNYTYDVEHAYGKKGHLQGQNCFGCPKIIGFPAESAGQVHGCVFKTLEGPALRQQMHKWKVPERHVAEMEKLIGHGNHYQLACIEYFKANHTGHEGDGVGNSPGDFFRRSCGHHAQKKEKEGAAAPEGSPTKNSAK